MPPSAFYALLLFLLSASAHARHSGKRWRLEDFPPAPAGNAPCVLIDPDALLKSEHGSEAAERACRETAQFLRARRLYNCEDEARLAFKVAVVLIEGGYDKKQAKSLQEFSDRLFRRWKLGEGSCDAAALIFISVAEQSLALSGDGSDVNPRVRAALRNQGGNIARALRNGRCGEVVHKGLALLTFGVVKYGLFGRVVVFLLFLAVGFYFCCRQPHEETPSGPLDAKALHQLRVNRYVERRADDANVASNETIYHEERCILCLNPFKEGRAGRFDVLAHLKNFWESRVVGCTLKCGHRCCSGCLKQWLVLKRACPHCRSVVSEISSLPSSSAAAAQPEEQMTLWEALTPVSSLPPPSRVSLRSSTNRTPPPRRNIEAEEANAELFRCFNRYGTPQAYHMDLYNMEVASLESYAGPSRPTRRRRRRTRRQL